MTVVIASAARTPFGSFGGALKDVPIPVLAATAVGEALSRSGLTPSDVDELILGVNLPGSDRSIARQAQLEAGIPEDRVSFTVDRACCSGLTAISRGRQAVLAEEAEIVVAGGAENLSLVPYFVHDLRWGHRLGPIELLDQLVISCPYTGVPRAQQAANEAAEFGIDRRQQDEWAARSQERAARASAAGWLAEEIVALEGLAADESPRPATTVEKLARLAPVNGSTTVTAGNAPGLSTGAAAAVLMSKKQANARNIEPLAELVSSAMASGHPQKIASMPAVAAQKALERAGIELEMVALLEVNEAFAAVPLVTSVVLANRYGESVDAIRDRMNVNGGAVALGHPTGATGVRMLLSLGYELRRRGGGYGLATICGGIGEAESIVLRV